MTEVLPEDTPTCNKKSCDRLKESGSDYCHLHACTNPFCRKPRREPFELCDDHVIEQAEEEARRFHDNRRKFDIASGTSGSATNQVEMLRLQIENDPTPLD